MAPSSCSSRRTTPPSGRYKTALVEDGIPATSFAVDDVQAEFDRLRSTGVRFTQEPTQMGARHDGRVRRHLRQSHPDRQGAVGPRRRRAPNQPL